MKMRILGLATAALAISGPLRADDQVRVVYEPSAATTARFETRTAQEVVRLGIASLLTRAKDEKGNPDIVQAEMVKVDKQTITFHYGKNLGLTGTIQLADV